jgi:hypothetical protein
MSCLTVRQVRRATVRKLIAMIAGLKPLKQPCRLFYTDSIHLPASNAPKEDCAKIRFMHTERSVAEPLSTSGGEALR